MKTSLSRFVKYKIHREEDFSEILLSNIILPEYLYSQVKALKNLPGIYTFYNNEKYALYIGKSLTVRSRVLSHIREASTDPRKNKFVLQTENIVWEQTAGEYTALFKEAEAVKQHMPLYNRLLRKNKSYITLQINPVKGLNTIEFTRKIDLDNLIHYYGLFKSVKAAKEYIESLCETHPLCKKLCGISKCSPCFKSQLGKCERVCAIKDYRKSHNTVLLEKIKDLQFKQWPYPGMVAVKEECQKTGLIQYILLYRWCYISIVPSLENLNSINVTHHLCFDKDYYNLAVKLLLSTSSENIIHLDYKVENLS